MIKDDTNCIAREEILATDGINIILPTCPMNGVIEFSFPIIVPIEIRFLLEHKVSFFGYDFNFTAQIPDDLSEE